MKYFFPLIAFISIYFNSTAQSDASAAKFMHVTVDGNDNDWHSLNFYDNETQLNFGIANDSNNIYLCFATANQSAEMKLMRAGMKIILSTKGKPKHEASIVYPLPQIKQAAPGDSSNDKSMNDNGTHAVFNKETFRQNYIAHHTTMQVSGFATISGEVPVNNYGMHVAINWDTSSNLIYEVAVSKKEFFGVNYSPKDAKNEITLSVELNGLSHTDIGDAKNSDDHHDTEIHESSAHGGGFNGASEKYKSQEGALLNNPNHASLNDKTSFKQRFVLNDGSE
jgi:hypothetical protein